MTITATMVKELRELTGAGMMDAKKALVETEGDMEKAMEVLRQKGMASADKKMSRIAAEGVIASYISDSVGAMIELNCETDFVAKNAEFKELAENLAKAVAELNPADVDALLASVCPECNKEIAEVIKEKIASIGEKITFRRFVRIEGSTSAYIHNGKIGVLLETDNKDEEIMKDICLHITSSAPQFVSRADIPQEVIDEETRIEMGKEDSNLAELLDGTPAFEYAIEHLIPKYREILYRRAYKGEKYKDIAKDYGVTGTRIFQIYKRASER